MNGSVKWSFSADRCWRRCQRQFFLQHIAAWHNARDPVRRESFLLKQVKTVELWQGMLVHRGIEKFVVPQWQARQAVDWSRAIELTTAMARSQFEFSTKRLYREPGLTKEKAGDDYCALAGHESGAGVSDTVLDGVNKVIERSFSNLAGMQDFLAEISGRERYWCELEVLVTYDAARIDAHIDLLFFRGFGKPTIVDWKISESHGGSDADLQTSLYAWALCQHPKWHVTRAEDCELLEVQLLSSTVLRHRADQGTFDRLEDRIYRSVNSLQAMGVSDGYNLADLSRYDFASNPNSCAFCSMRSLCQQLADQRSPELVVGSSSRPHRHNKERVNEQACLQLF
jgi:hypothetical protein